jgi:hypothetical protein
MKKIIRRFRFRDGAPAGHRIVEIPRCGRLTPARDAPPPTQQQMSWALRLRQMNLSNLTFWNAKKEKL